MSNNKKEDKGGYSREGFLGQINHYDKNGKKIGESRPSAFGGYNDYDASGKRIGESRPNFLGGYDNYRDGKKVSETYQSPLGWNTYDKDGKHFSHDNMIGDTVHDSASGHAMPPKDSGRTDARQQAPQRSYYSSGSSSSSTADSIYAFIGGIFIFAFIILIIFIIGYISV